MASRPVSETVMFPNASEFPGTEKLWRLAPMLLEVHFAARQSMFERGDCSERVGYALAVQQCSLVEGTVPNKQQKDQELLLGA